ncbi:MAG: ATP-binding protein, partial [Pseudobdellovibrionaceae bacterium]
DLGLLDFLFNDLDKKSEKFINANTALTTVFGSDDMQWMLMEDNLPKELDISINQQIANLKVSYNPLYAEDGLLNQIMLIVDDVTKERQLMAQIEAERKANQEKAQVLQELSRQSPEEIKSFFGNCLELIGQCQDQASSPERLAEYRNEIFRNLHTIKGNSKVFGFDKLGSYVHHIEQFVSQLKNHDTIVEDNVNHVQSELLNCLRIISNYTDVAEKVLKVPNKDKSAKIKMAHTDLMQNDNLNDKVLVQSCVSILSAYLPLEILNNAYEKRIDLVQWISSEVLSRGLLFKASIENNYLKNAGADFSTLVYLCERDTLNNKSQLVLDKTKDIKNIETLYDDLCELRNFLESKNCFNFRKEIENVQLKSSTAKQLLVGAGTACKSDYMFMVRCYELVNTYAANRQALASVQESNFTVYEEHWLSLMTKLSLLQNSNNYVDGLVNSLKTISYLPFKKSLVRYYYMVDSLSLQLGKKVRLQVKGSESYLPNESIEILNGALTHLVRNSLDHGIESPELRVQNQKNEAGSISITTHDLDNKVCIVVEDDGKGLDPALLRKKGVEKGIITQAQAEKMSDQNAIELIFAAEFSTKDAVTDISGRGVGMDAVKMSIERDLKGQLSITSKVGFGTTIRIEIPKYIEETYLQKNAA